jgi:uncharacterized FlaG/YvyC family protein
MKRGEDMQIDATLPIMIVEPVTPVHAYQPPPNMAQTPTPKQPGLLIPSTGNTADAKQADQAVHELNQAIEPFNVDLKFSKDVETGTIVIQMIDKKSGEELQQFPTEATLHVSATLRKLQGKIFSCKA